MPKYSDNLIEPLYLPTSNPLGTSPLIVKRLSSLTKQKGPLNLRDN